MMRIACIGEAMIELSMQGNEAGLGVAGDTLNTAIYLKRSASGIAVDYVTCLGDDPFSERIRDFIAGQGLGVEAIARVPGKSPGLYAITTTPAGERSFTYWRSASAAREVFQTAGRTDFSVLAAYDWIYLSGISIAILPQNVRRALLAWLVDAPVKLAFDSNYRPRLWESPEVARDVTQAFWARADLLLPSIDDEEDLFGETAEQVTQRFLTFGKPGALKRSALGPLSLGEGVAQDYPPAPKVIDTTAAGDSFNGGYLGAFLSGKSQAEALMAGHLLAARVVQHRGAIIPEVQDA
jgi:2-dehydro-3-deoxygluconokinase